MALRGEERLAVRISELPFDLMAFSFSNNNACLVEKVTLMEYVWRERYQFIKTSQYSKRTRTDRRLFFLYVLLHTLEPFHLFWIHQSTNHREQELQFRFHLSHVVSARSRLTVSVGGGDVTPDSPAATDLHSTALLQAAGCSLSSLSELSCQKSLSPSQYTAPQPLLAF